MALGKDKFSIDTLVNLFSVGFGGVLYILVNAIIIHQCGEDVLGVFNLTYALYIIASQIAVFGIHLSIQMWIPRLLKEPERINEAMTSSLLLTTLTSVTVVVIAYLFIDLAVVFFDSSGLEKGLTYSLWGIIFFSLNKVLLSYINGLRKMKVFALFTFLRFALMFSILLIIVFGYKQSGWVTAIVSLTEFILFIVLIIYSLVHFRIRFTKGVLNFVKKHFDFGRKAFIGNLMLDINTRVDILMLGYLMTDTAVGIYGFVIAVSVGILQIPVVFRNNINPIITKAATMKNVSGKLNEILGKSIRSFYKVIGGLSLLTVMLYPVGLLVLGIQDFFMTYWALYAILILGIIISAGYLPFAMLFNQMNKPKVQSKFFFYVFISNVIANFIFIKLFGLFGAAIGTSVASVAMVFFIRTLARKHCNLKI